jgi:hypothetical protein
LDDILDAWERTVIEVGELSVQKWKNMLMHIRQMQFAEDHKRVLNWRKKTQYQCMKMIQKNWNNFLETDGRKVLIPKKIMKISTWI